MPLTDNQIRNRKRLLIALAVAQGGAGITLGILSQFLEALSPTSKNILNIMGCAFTICALDTTREIITGVHAEAIEGTELEEVLVYPSNLSS